MRKPKGVNVLKLFRVQIICSQEIKSRFSKPTGVFIPSSWISSWMQNGRSYLRKTEFKFSNPSPKVLKIERISPRSTDPTNFTKLRNQSLKKIKFIYFSKAKLASDFKVQKNNLYFFQFRIFFKDLITNRNFYCFIKVMKFNSFFLNPKVEVKRF